MQKPSYIEIFLNSQSADITVCQIAIQTILIQLLRQGDPRTEPAFQRFSQYMLAAVDNTAPSPGDPQDGERHKQLTRVRAEQFLQETALAIGLDPAKIGDRGATN